MATLKAIEAHLGELLRPDDYKDSAVNGVQVACDRPITKVASGVTASLALIEEAVSRSAQLVLAHHGLFWEGHSPALIGGLFARVRLLVQHDMALAAYHLPLDAHPEFGNNAIIANHLRLAEIQPWGTYKGAVIGMAGTLRPTPVADLVETIRSLVGRDVLHFAGGPRRVATVAVVSGGAASMATDAARQGFDLYLTGEPSESCMHVAAEESIHIVAAGHHATETFGVKALGERLAEHFGIEAVHLDLPNPV